MKISGQALISEQIVELSIERCNSLQKKLDDLKKEAEILEKVLIITNESIRDYTKIYDNILEQLAIERQLSL